MRIEIGRAPAQLAAIKRLAEGLRRLGLESDDVTWGAQQRLALRCRPPPSSSRLRNAVETLRDKGRRRASAGSTRGGHRRRRPRSGEGTALRGADRGGVRLPSTSRCAGEALTRSRSRRSSPAARTAHSPTPGGPRGGSSPASSSSSISVPPSTATRSDMTRTVCVGDPRSSELRDLLEAVIASRRAGVRAVRAGVRTRGRPPRAVSR